MVIIEGSPAFCLLVHIPATFRVANLGLRCCFYVPSPQINEIGKEIYENIFPNNTFRKVTFICEYEKSFVKCFLSKIQKWIQKLSDHHSNKMLEYI